MRRGHSVTTARWSTRVVGGLAIAGALLMMFLGLVAFVVAQAHVADLRANEECESGCGHGDAITEYVIAFATTGVGVWAAAAGVGMLRDRHWARRSVVITFTVWAAWITFWVVGAAAAPGGSDTIETAIGLLVATLFLAVAVMAARSGGGRRPRRQQLETR
jgi:cytosine/uracil/thiamine/allantoin permease